MRRERREEARCGNEGEKHRGENLEGTILTDRGRQREEHRKTHRRTYSMEKQNIRHNKT